MLKRTIKFIDFNDEEAEETHYFNLTETEMTELSVSGGSYQETIQRIIDTRDRESLYAHFKSIILKAYGIKSDDGRKFTKNEEIRIDFEQTAAFDALMVELMSNDTAAATFLRDVLPAKVRGGFDDGVAESQASNSGPPSVASGSTPPAPPT
jgi:hypothetical protein